MRIQNLSQEQIKEGLERAAQSVERIRKELRVDASIGLRELFPRVLNDLEKMGYKAIHDDILIDPSTRQSVPALTVFNDIENRKSGGIIKLSREYPKAARFEALFHEYVHIKDDTLPVILTMENDYVLDKLLAGGRLCIEPMENMVDLITYTLMMPPAQIKKDLWKNEYNIDQVLKEYCSLEKCTVLQWITINSLVPCHFSWVMLENTANADDPPIVFDSCTYDRQNNPGTFNIDVILGIHDSAAATSSKERRDINKQTVIKGRAYQCYAYFETDINKQLCTVKLEAPVTHYSQLLVIGWEKNAFAEMQKTMNDAKEIFGA